VDGERIGGAKDVAKKIANVAPGKSVSLTLYRQGQERTVTVEIGAQPKA
jgi:serine protease Do